MLAFLLPLFEPSPVPSSRSQWHFLRDVKSGNPVTPQGLALRMAESPTPGTPSPHGTGRKAGGGSALVGFIHANRSCLPATRPAPHSLPGLSATRSHRRPCVGGRLRLGWCAKARPVVPQGEGRALPGAPGQPASLRQPREPPRQPCLLQQGFSAQKQMLITSNYPEEEGTGLFVLCSQSDRELRSGKSRSQKPPQRWSEGGRGV